MSPACARRLRSAADLPINPRMTRPAPSDREAGFALVETLVSAALLVVIALALLAGADRAASTAGQSRARSTAAAIAEQDQERMRSMPVTALSNYHPVGRPVPSGAVNYTVTSRADWVRDSTATTASCTDTGQSNYLRITSTVTSNVVGTATKPVTMTSIVAPPVGSFDGTEGTLAVLITDRADKPVVGMNVSISGGASLSDTTNAAGCAVFAYIPRGQYHVLLNTPGWVDPANKTAVDFLATVSAASVSLANHSYDRAAKVAVSYETWVSGAAVASKGWGATAAQNLTGGVISSFKATAPPQTSVDATSLYPVASGLKFYAGECAGASPETPIPNWFTTAPGSGDLLIPAPGSTNGAVTVRQPPLTLVVKNGTSTITGAHVVLTPQSAGCTKLALTTDASGRANKTQTTPYDPGIPFGKYDVCVDALPTASSARKVWRSSSALDVKVANGPNTAPGTTATTGVLDFASQGSNVSTTNLVCS
jgi:Tfp pilus assembly protein PilV